MSATAEAERLSVQERSPSRRIAALGFPLLLGALSQTAAGTIDTAMMGHYGTRQVAAVAAASAIFDLFASIVFASAVAHQILVARFAGRDDPAGVRASLRSSALFCGAIAVVLFIVCVTAGGWLTSLASGGDAGLGDIGAGYLAARAPTLLLLVPFTLLVAIFNAYERPFLSTATAVVVNVVNLVLDILLIFGPGPFPRLGAVGNGLATTLAWGVATIVIAVAARRFRLLELLRRPGNPAPVDFVTSVPRLSWPSIVSAAVDYASIVVFFAIVGGLGTAELGGARIAFETMVLLFATAMAFAVGGRILIGRSLGAHDLAATTAFWRTGRRLLVLPACAVGIALIVRPEWFALAFTSFHPLVHAAGRALPFVGASLPFLAWALGNSSLLRALGRTRADMLANLAPVVCVQLTLSFLLTHVAHLGIAGAYIGVLGYWVARAGATEILARRALAHEAATALPKEAT